MKIIQLLKFAFILFGVVTLLLSCKADDDGQITVTTASESEGEE